MSENKMSFNKSKSDYIVVTFSGGKDSTAMLLRMIELGEKIDEVIFVDTYKEFPAMYRHLDRVKAEAEKAGIKFTTLKREKSFDYFMFEFSLFKRVFQRASRTERQVVGNGKSAVVYQGNENQRHPTISSQVKKRIQRYPMRRDSGRRKKAH